MDRCCGYRSVRCRTARRVTYARSRETGACARAACSQAARRRSDHERGGNKSALLTRRVRGAARYDGAVDLETGAVLNETAPDAILASRIPGIRGFVVIRLSPILR